MVACGYVVRCCLVNVCMRRCCGRKRFPPTVWGPRLREAEEAAKGTPLLNEFVAEGDGGLSVSSETKVSGPSPAAAVLALSGSVVGASVVENPLHVARTGSVSGSLRGIAVDADDIEEWNPQRRKRRSSRRLVVR